MTKLYLQEAFFFVNTFIISTNSIKCKKMNHNSVGSSPIENTVICFILLHRVVRIFCFIEKLFVKVFICICTYSPFKVILFYYSYKHYNIKNFYALILRF